MHHSGGSWAAAASGECTCINDSRKAPVLVNQHRWRVGRERTGWRLGREECRLRIERRRLPPVFYSLPVSIRLTGSTQICTSKITSTSPSNHIWAARLIPRQRNKCSFTWTKPLGPETPQQGAGYVPVTQMRWWEDWAVSHSILTWK